MQRLLISFLLRWGASILGLWVAEAILGEERFFLGGSITTLLVTGLVVAAINTVLKPFLVFLSLPAILITLGLFMLVVNGLTILIADWLYGPFEVSGLLVAIAAGIILALVNFLISALMKDVTKET